MNRIKLILGSAVTAGALAFCWYQAADILDTPVYEFPACETEADMGPCFWDASERGNGIGQDFWVVDGVVTYAQP